MVSLTLSSKPFVLAGVRRDPKSLVPFLGDFRMLRFKLAMIVALFAVFALVQTSMADVIVNGGFEANRIPSTEQTHGNQWYTAPYGALNPTTGVTGWTFSSSVSPGWTGLVSAGSWELAIPGQAAFLEAKGWISQSVSIVAAGTATLSFSALTSTLPALKSDPFTVTFGGKLLTFGASNTITAPKSNSTMTSYSNSFVVTAGSYDLVFTGTSSDAAAVVVLDNVSMSVAVPEPSAIILLVGGLLGLLAYAWRKRK